MVKYISGIGYMPDWWQPSGTEVSTPQGYITATPASSGGHAGGLGKPAANPFIKKEPVVYKEVDESRATLTTEQSIKRQGLNVEPLMAGAIKSPLEPKIDPSWGAVKSSGAAMFSAASVGMFNLPFQTAEYGRQWYLASKQGYGREFLLMSTGEFVGSYVRGIKQDPVKTIGMTAGSLVGGAAAMSTIGEIKNVFSKPKVTAVKGRSISFVEDIDDTTTRGISMADYESKTPRGSVETRANVLFKQKDIGEGHYTFTGGEAKQIIKQKTFFGVEKVIDERKLQVGGQAVSIQKTPTKTLSLSEGRAFYKGEQIYKAPAIISSDLVDDLGKIKLYKSTALGGKVKDMFVMSSDDIVIKPETPPKLTLFDGRVLERGTTMKPFTSPAIETHVSTTKSFIEPPVAKPTPVGLAVLPKTTPSPKTQVQPPTGTMGIRAVEKKELRPMVSGENPFKDFMSENPFDNLQSSSPLIDQKYNYESLSSQMEKQITKQTQKQIPKESTLNKLDAGGITDLVQVSDMIVTSGQKNIPEQLQMQKVVQVQKTTPLKPPTVLHLAPAQTIKPISMIPMVTTNTFKRPKLKSNIKFKTPKRRKEKLLPRADILSFNIQEMKTLKRAKHPRATPRVTGLFEERLSKSIGTLRFPTAQELRSKKMAKRKKRRAKRRKSKR